MKGLRICNAGNRGLFTLDGTRTFIVGTRDVAIIDPGPPDAAHIEAVVEAVAGASSVQLLLTHGHGDHAGATTAVVERTGASVFGFGHASAQALPDGGSVATDAGDLRCVYLPGHTVDHVGFVWESACALFAGDLLLGEGDTTWVAGYPTCVDDYLVSLDRVDSLDLDRIYPAHGPTLVDPKADVARFRAHRLHRIEQVRQALDHHPGATAAELLEHVYGVELPSAVRGYAIESLQAILDHLRGSRHGW